MKWWGRNVSRPAKETTTPSYPALKKVEVIIRSVLIFMNIIFVHKKHITAH
jgi:hypothetical protein